MQGVRHAGPFWGSKGEASHHPCALESSQVASVRCSPQAQERRPRGSGTRSVRSPSGGWVQVLPQKGDELANKSSNSLLTLSHQSATHPISAFRGEFSSKHPLDTMPSGGSARAGCPTPSPFK